MRRGFLNVGNLRFPRKTPRIPQPRYRQSINRHTQPKRDNCAATRCPRSGQRAKGGGFAAACRIRQSRIRLAARVRQNAACSDGGVCRGGIYRGGIESRRVQKSRANQKRTPREGTQSFAPAPRSACAAAFSMSAISVFPAKRREYHNRDIGRA